MIVQSSVCGKVFQSEHLATLAGYSVIISILFFSLSWHIDFIGNIIRNMLPSIEENSVKNQFSESIVHAFYMFWAGMYSSASLSWFATACPLPSTESKA
jgi:flagellar biosynthesis protein FlhB